MRRFKGWAEAKIRDAAERCAIESRFRDVDAVRRELLAVRAEVCGRKTELAPELRALLHRPENGVFAAQHLGRFREIAFFNCATDCSAAHDRAVDRDWLNADDFEVLLAEIADGVLLMEGSSVREVMRRR